MICSDNVIAVPQIHDRSCPKLYQTISNLCQPFNLTIPPSIFVASFPAKKARSNGKRDGIASNPTRIFSPSSAATRIPSCWSKKNNTFFGDRWMCLLKYYESNAM